MDAAFEELTRKVNQRFDEYLAALPGPAPRHLVRFSKRMTTSWALIYYRRHLVRLSPYLFLLDPDDLRHGSHWRELDATICHEAIHAYLFAKKGETGHCEEFRELLARFGFEPNGGADLGPENVAFRYHYHCPTCERSWPRRVPLKGNWSCGYCAPGRYDAEHKMLLSRTTSPWRRLHERKPWVKAAIEEARHAKAPALVPVPLVRS